MWPRQTTAHFSIGPREVEIIVMNIFCIEKLDFKPSFLGLQQSDTVIESMLTVVGLQLLIILIVKFSFNQLINP